MKHAAISLYTLLVLLPSAAEAQTTAAEVSFDDTTTTQIQGSDVQEALESADTVLGQIDADVTAFHSGLNGSASTILVRGDCTGLADCFTDLTAAAFYLWVQRPAPPSALDRVLVDVGPGRFGLFFCPDGGATPHGYVTVRGAGPGTTEIYQPTGFGGFLNFTGAVVVDSCVELEFESLTIKSEAIGVLWNGPGSSRWSNIEVVAGGEGEYTAGWLEGTDGDYSCQPSTHYWYGSKVKATGGSITNTAYYVNIPCAEHWFYGGEIEAEMSVVGATTPKNNRAVQVNSGDFRAFGTALRSHLGAYTGDIISGVLGVGTGAAGPSDATFQMHGGIINANSVGAAGPLNATGLSVGAGTTAHTPDTAFVVKVGAAGGTAIRAAGAADDVQSPFLWPASGVPPIDASVGGEDQYVETDCDSTGDCIFIENACGSGQPAGTCSGPAHEPHLMVFWSSCTTSPWFDVVTGRCRNQ